MSHKKSLCEKLLKYTDSYAFQIQFNSFGDKKFPTVIGSICTILVIVPCAILLLNNFQEAVSQTVPTVYRKLLETPDTSVINSHYKSIRYSIWINKTSPQHSFWLICYIIPSINLKTSMSFNFNNVYVLTTEQIKQIILSIKQINKQSCTPIPLETCDLNKHFLNKEQKKFFKNFDFRNTQCIDSKWSDSNRAVNKKFQIKFLQGYGSADEYAYIQIRARACQNSSQFQECASPHEIAKQLTNTNMIVYQSSNSFDQSLKGSPYQSITTRLYTSVSLKNTKSVYDYYTQDKTITDIGLLNTKIQSHETIIYSNQLESSSLEQSEFFLDWFIMLDNKEKTSYRSYQKLQNILGNISGLYSLIYSVVLIIISPLINKLVKIQLAMPYFMEQTNKLNENTSLNKSNNTSITEILNSFIQSKNKKSSFSIRQILNSFFGLNVILNEEIMIVENSWDINILIKKLIEFDKLKSILFDENQLNLLNQLKNVGQLKEQTPFEQLQKLDNSYQYIIQKEQKTPLDQIFLKKLDNNIVQLFKELQNQRELDIITKNLNDKKFEQEFLINSEGNIQDLQFSSMINTVRKKIENKKL